jgi:hypothetical protein
LNISYDAFLLKRLLTTGQASLFRAGNICVLSFQGNI